MELGLTRIDHLTTAVAAAPNLSTALQIITEDAQKRGYLETWRPHKRRWIAENPEDAALPQEQQVQLMVDVSRAALDSRRANTERIKGLCRNPEACGARRAELKAKEPNLNEAERDEMNILRLARHNLG